VEKKSKLKKKPRDQKVEKINNKDAMRQRGSCSAGSHRCHQSIVQFSKTIKENILGF